MKTNRYLVALAMFMSFGRTTFAQAPGQKPQPQQLKALLFFSGAPKGAGCCIG